MYLRALPCYFRWCIWIKAAPGRQQCGNCYILDKPDCFTFDILQMDSMEIYLVEYPSIFFLYLSVYELFALKHTHLFLKTGGFMEFPPYWTALLVTAIFWGMQSLVYLLCKIVQSVWRRKPFSSK